jgi:hypothetical protein
VYVLEPWLLCCIHQRTPAGRPQSQASLLGEANRQQAALRDELAALNARLAAAQGAVVGSEARSSQVAACIMSLAAWAAEGRARDAEARVLGLEARALRAENLAQEFGARARTSEARCAGLTTHAEALEGEARAFERRFAESAARVEGLSARLRAFDARATGPLAHAEELARKLALAQVGLTVVGLGLRLLLAKPSSGWLLCPCPRHALATSSLTAPPPWGAHRRADAFTQSRGFTLFNHPLQVRLEGIQATHAANTAELRARLAGMGQRLAAAERRCGKNQVGGGLLDCGWEGRGPAADAAGLPPLQAPLCA